MIFFFKQKTAYDMRISDWSSDVCSSDLMAMRDGRPAFASCLAESDAPQGWRAQRKDGGVLFDIASGEAVLRGLSMPHSPRWHDGALWLLESGAGRLLRVDAASGSAEEICALPGYLRGLDFVGPHALIGLCKARETDSFGGLPVQARHRELRSEEHPSELQSLLRISYAVICLKKQ